jgi:hypothetical protein
MNLGQREPELFAFKNHLEACRGHRTGGLVLSRRGCNEPRSS